jgi:hypothetical protein
VGLRKSFILRSDHIKKKRKYPNILEQQEIRKKWDDFKTASRNTRRAGTENRTLSEYAEKKMEDGYLDFVTYFGQC